MKVTKEWIMYTGSHKKIRSKSHLNQWEFLTPSLTDNELGIDVFLVIKYTYPKH